MCLQHADEKLQQGLEKLQRDEEAVQAARKRNEDVNSERRARAGEQNQSWKERNETAATTRAQLAVTSDTDLQRKQAALAERMSREMQRLEEDRAARAAQKESRIKEAQVTATSLLEMNADKVLAKQMEKSLSCQQNLAVKQQTYENKANGDYAEVAREKLQRKKEIEKETQRKAAQEVKMKTLRNQATIEKQNQSKLKQMRELKKTKSTADFSPTSPVAETIASLDMGNTQGSMAMGTLLPDDMAEAASPNSTLKEMPDDEVEGEASPDSQQQVDAASPSSALTQKARPASPSDDSEVVELLKAQLASMKDGGRGRNRRGSNHSGMDHDDENAIVRDLEKRGVKWLHELRRKQAAWKPC